MKARRVIVTLEIETRTPISFLRRASYWHAAHGITNVKQVQVNIVKAKK